MIYKAQSLMTPNYITVEFTQESDENPKYYYGFTCYLNLKLCKSGTNAWKMSFASVRNTLPLNIKTLDSLNTFRDKCYQHFIPKLGTEN